MEHGPIFVGGADRSGKTLMRLSLSAHPRLAMTRRTYMWTFFYNQYGDLRDPDNFERCLAAMLKHAPVRALAPNPERIRREFRQGQPSYARLFALFHQHYAEREGKPRWGEQVGAIEEYADAIFAAYPSARLIHMIRDPRDRLETIRASSAAGTSRIGSTTARWRHSARLARRNVQRYPDCYLVIRYESLLARREEALREVCDFIGEPFVPNMVTLEGTTRSGSDEALAGATDERPDPRPFSQRELAFVQRYARQEMLAYGYKPQPLRLSLGERLALAFIDWPTNIARAAAWHTLETLQSSFPAHIARKQLITKARS
ncbi:MAG TPA: sulfotransferase [Herpetosiphonaceae bacterium]